MASNSSLVFLLFCLCGIFLSEALGFSVELIHHDSPRSPFYLPTDTHAQRVANSIRNSINRANHFNQAFSPTNTLESPILYNDAYFMSYSVGTPPFQVYGFVDTGSDFVWLQCKPCEKCYNQTSPMFDPSKSTTYKTVPCTSNTCHYLRNTSCSSDNQQNCKYIDARFKDAPTSGDLSLETLTLDSTSGSPISFPKTVIGCGHNNPFPITVPASGMVGLGNGPLSLISQMGPSIGGKFSYCLVPIPSQSNTSSKLHFGDDAVVSGDETVSIPMVPKGYYFLILKGFSVGDNRVEFGNSSSSGDSLPGNTIITSLGAPTVLPNDLYSRFESAVSNVVKLERTKGPMELFNLCYKGTIEKLGVLAITAHFNGADIQLNASNTFIQFGDEVVCLAFITSEITPIAIIGNIAQQNFLVGYDLQKNIVSFKPTDCTKQ